MNNDNLGPLPETHPREKIVRSAELTLGNAYSAIAKEAGLTTGERVRVLTNFLSDSLGHIANFSIRQERQEMEKIDRKSLEVWIKKIVEGGPARVVINASGEAACPERAFREYHVVPDIIYVREDAWSLGAPVQFGTVAESIWPDMWAAVAWKDADGWRWRRYGTKEEAEKV